MNIIRASELGSCIKALVAAQLGYTPMDAPERMQEVYERGNVHEEDCAHALKVDGWTIIGEQREIVLDVLDGWQIVGHLDGIIGLTDSDITPDRVWEAKSPATYDKFEQAYKRNDWSDPLAHRYAWQISAYMLATGLEAYVTSWDEERGVRGFGIEVPPFSALDIKDRVAFIATWVDRGELTQTCSQVDYPCPFYYLHEDAEEVVEDPVLDRMVDDYNSAGADIKRRTENQKMIQAKIREHLGGKDILTASSKVTFYEQAAATRYDYDAMRADGIDVDKYKIAGKPSERMKITRRDDATRTES